MDKEKVVYIFNHTALKRKEILVHATRETWGHYTKWNKPVIKKNHCIIPRMWGIHMNSFWKLESSHHTEEPKLPAADRETCGLSAPSAWPKPTRCERGCGGPKAPAHAPPDCCLTSEPRRDQHRPTQLSPNCRAPESEANQWWLFEVRKSQGEIVGQQQITDEVLAPNCGRRWAPKCRRMAKCH